MPFADQMLAGVELMALGMGIVFSFLILLVFILRLMSSIAAKIAPDEKEHPQQVMGSAAIAAEDDTELVAVISAAVNRFRSSRRG